MHGDEAADEEGEEAMEVDDEEEISAPPFRHDDYSPLNCPQLVPKMMKPGDLIAMWFGEPYNCLLYTSPSPRD